jgi:hypothetical protein
MVEFHGWAVLRWAGNATGSDAQMSAIRQALDSARSDFSTAGIVTPGNDLTIVCVHGLRNHRTPSIQHLFAVIAKRHPSRTACCTFVMLRTRGDSISRTAFGSGGSLAGNAPRWPTPSFTAHSSDRDAIPFGPGAVIRFCWSAACPARGRLTLALSHQRDCHQHRGCAAATEPLTVACRRWAESPASRACV